MWWQEGAPRQGPPPLLESASHTAYCDILDEFLTAWLLTSWTVTWNKWRHKEETQGSGLGEVGCWGVKLSGCKIALQTCSAFTVCWWALNALSLIHHHLYSFEFFLSALCLCWFFFSFFFWRASIFIKPRGQLCLFSIHGCVARFCYQSNKRVHFCSFLKAKCKRSGDSILYCTVLQQLWLWAIKCRVVNCL